MVFHDGPHRGHRFPLLRARLIGPRRRARLGFAPPPSPRAGRPGRDGTGPVGGAAHHPAAGRRAQARRAAPRYAALRAAEGARSSSRPGPRRAPRGRQAPSRPQAVERAGDARGARRHPRFRPRGGALERPHRPERAATSRGRRRTWRRSRRRPALCRPLRLRGGRHVHEALTGRRPFEGGALDVILRAGGRAALLRAPSRRATEDLDALCAAPLRRRARRAAPGARGAPAAAAAERRRPRQRRRARRSPRASAGAAGRERRAVRRAAAARRRRAGRSSGRGEGRATTLHIYGRVGHGQDRARPALPRRPRAWMTR